MSKTTFINRGLSVAIKKQYLDESTADIHFVFESGSGESERIPAHKVLLSASSGVFQAMFNGSWKEQDEVKIVDASAAAFKKFLQFFYYDKVEMGMEDVEDVLRLGQKYLVADCLKACSQLLTENLTDENVCVAYGLSIVADQKELKKLCEVSIGINAKDVFATKGFLECEQQVLSHILKLESLSCSEIQVFKACMDWVKAVSKQCDLNKETVVTHLGDLFYDIRFGSMTTDELNGIFSSYETLFTAELRTEIVQMITSKDSKQSKNEKRPRQCAWDKEILLDCKRITKESFEPYHLEGSQSTTFTTNKPLLLREILCAEVFEDYEYMHSIADDLGERNLTITEHAGPTKAANKQSRTIYVDEHLQLASGSDTLIRLSKPVIIKAGLKYEIRIEDKDDYDYDEGLICTNIKLKSSRVQLQPDITVSFHGDPVMDGNKRGLFYGLKFSRF